MDAVTVGEEARKLIEWVEQLYLKLDQAQCLTDENKYYLLRDVSDLREKLVAAYSPLYLEYSLFPQSESEDEAPLPPPSRLHGA